MKKFNISDKQKEILSLLLKFRFLTRKQIQAMLGHKHPGRIFAWLDDLKQNDYLCYYYQKNFDNQPALYSLGKNGRKCLKKEMEIGKKADKIRKEKKYSQRFKENCIFIANIYLSLTKLKYAKIHFYTKTELSGMEHMLSPKPDAYFAVENKGGVKRYFLEVFNSNLRSNILRHRVKEYLSYYNDEEWQDNTDKPFPEIILILPNEKAKNHIYFYLKNKLDEQEPVFYLTFKKKVKDYGLTSEVLEKVIIEDD
ncbi:MAG: hypothetical protein BWY19_00203 [bacterium ADurb.Bin212]|nr:MAG: hypothetical protein BWY19_00203 [bacterium ADurb.Bin212]